MIKRKSKKVIQEKEVVQKKEVPNVEGTVGVEVEVIVEAEVAVLVEARVENEQEIIQIKVQNKKMVMIIRTLYPHFEMVDVQNLIVEEEVSFKK